VAVREEFDGEWSDRWLEERAAPALVRMQVKSAGRYWPDLLMKVQR
jgi:general secretion pathway protein J